jgi:hypothetical protein
MFKDKRVRLYLAFVVGYTALELLSWIGYNVPALGSFIFFALVAVTAVLSWYRPGLGVLAVLAELFVGSQGGYMFALGPANVDGAILSLRMGLFLAVFCAWLARSIVSVVKHRGLGELVWLKAMRENMLLWPYVALLVVFAFGALRGLAGGNSFGNVFFDANGYAFYALFPAFIEGLAEAKSRRLMWYILAAAVTVSLSR